MTEWPTSKGFGERGPEAPRIGLGPAVPVQRPVVNHIRPAQSNVLEIKAELPALVKAHRWRRRIEGGRAKSITALAAQDAVTDAYVHGITGSGAGGLGGAEPPRPGQGRAVPVEMRRILRLLAGRVDVATDGIEVRLCAKGARSLVTGLAWPLPKGLDDPGPSISADRSPPTALPAWSPSFSPRLVKAVPRLTAMAAISLNQ
jgi:hypothetical protein